MLTEERLNKILTILEEQGQVKSKALSESLSVSEVTIRADLNLLEQKGLLVRVHGGAVKLKTKIFDPSFQEQKAIDKSEKLEMAKKAASIVDKNDVLFVDAGSSTLFFIEELLKNPPLNLTVVTNSLYIINEVVQYENINLFVLGGTFQKSSLNFIDLDICPLLQKYSVNKVFLGINGMDETGFYASNTIEARVKTEICALNTNIYIFASSSKLFKKSLKLISDWKGKETIISSTKCIQGFEQLNHLKLDKGVNIL
ncbi:MAG: DeoR/GlpR family DNA-binding transcription regulator [Thermotogota bacterium]